MTAINAYIKGWGVLFNHKKMWMMVYLFNVLFAAIMLLPAKNFLTNTIGNSLAADKILKKFDYPYISDIIDNHIFTMSMIKDQSIVVIILFLFFSIFMMGGIIGSIRRGQGFSFRPFWSDCGYYFWRFLRLTIFFLIIHAIALTLAGFAFSSIGLNPFKMESDAVFVTRFKIVGTIYLFLAVFIFMIQDYAKLQIVKMDKTFINRPILQSIRLIFKNFFPCLLLYLINIFFFLLIAGLYYLLRTNLKMTSDGTILMAFLIGQLFLMVRIGLKFLNLMSANHLMEKIDAPSVETKNV